MARWLRSWWDWLTRPRRPLADVIDELADGLAAGTVVLDRPRDRPEV